MESYTLGEMVDEAWMESAGRYTVDFGGSNFLRVAGLAAKDFIELHPQYADLEGLIMGGVHEKLRSFQREVMKNREG